MIENLDMNICTEILKPNICMACSKVQETNHYVVAERKVIVLCTDCLEKLCIRGIERVGYKKIKIFNKEIFMKGRNKWKTKENITK